MRKYSFFCFIFVLSLAFFGCSVNSTTGRIKLVNLSDTPVTNIILGETFVYGFLAVGAVADYWFFNEDIKDVVPKASGFKYDEENGKRITFKLNYHGRIEFRKEKVWNGVSYLISANQGFEQGGDRYKN